MAADTELRIPLAVEELAVSKRAVETGRVRISTRVLTREETVTQALAREDVEVVRIPVGRDVDAVPATREEADGTLVIPLVEERLVIERRLVLREEVHVRRRRSVETVNQPVTLRREEVEIERLPPAAAGAVPGEIPPTPSSDSEES
ncbi:MAG TPA: YsnF/AvaK domain-containing protein [Azospirillaceae bacterium]|nr:YsnF/AvaK domain-containing protein [Azospirillaceae bacterium]